MRLSTGVAVLFLLMGCFAFGLVIFLYDQDPPPHHPSRYAEACPLMEEGFLALQNKNFKGQVCFELTNTKFRDGWYCVTFRDRKPQDSPDLFKTY